MVNDTGVSMGTKPEAQGGDSLLPPGNLNVGPPSARRCRWGAGYLAGGAGVGADRQEGAGQVWQAHPAWASETVGARVPGTITHIITGPAVLPNFVTRASESAAATKPC